MGGSLAWQPFLHLQEDLRMEQLGRDVWRVRKKAERRVEPKVRRRVHRPEPHLTQPGDLVVRLLRAHEGCVHREGRNRRIASSRRPRPGRQLEQTVRERVAKLRDGEDSGDGRSVGQSAKA